MKSSLPVHHSRTPRNRATRPSLLLSAKVAKSLSVSLAAAFVAAATMQAANVAVVNGEAKFEALPVNGSIQLVPVS